ncbi:hypothetical protein ACWEOZ_15330 [Actinoplanes sp. NPDC004185]
MTTTAVTPALITASASVLVAAAVFVANLIVQFRNERRQVALERLNAQLRELYGPLYAQYEVNETIWRALRASGLPGREIRRAGTATEAQRAEWRLWVQEALMPGNVRMRDAVIEHADLLIEDEVPRVLGDFCSHVASYEVVLAQSGDRRKQFARALVPHPGEEFGEYVRNSFALLKQRQATLLGTARPATQAGRQVPSDR